VVVVDWFVTCPRQELRSHGWLGSGWGWKSRGTCSAEARKPDGQDGALVGQAGWRRSGVLREQMPLPPPERLVEPLPPPELELLERGAVPRGMSLPRLLLDTHMLRWWLSEPERLSPAVAATLADRDPLDRLLVTQAELEPWTLVTVDPALSGLPCRLLW